MKIKKDFKLREICGEYVVTAEGMQAVDFTKLISLNETAAFLWKTAEKQGGIYGSFVGSGSVR